MLGLALVVASGCGAGEPVGSPPVRRVLIVSVPGVAWSDVERGALPTLQRFAAGAAVGDMATRIGRRPADTADAYLTIGSGTRAVAPAVEAGVALHADEVYRGVPATEILERRLGEVPDGIVYLAVGAARDRNDNSPYGAEIGTLGDGLVAAGIRRAVIANADEIEGVLNDPPLDDPHGREAVTALMGSDGEVPYGSVGRRLLQDDPAAPFGRRLERGIMLETFDEVWALDGPSDRVAVLVEASDLTRVASYASRTTPSHQRSLRDRALADADALLAALLERIDPDHDAVMVMSPVAPRGEPALGIAAVQAPGVDHGLLRSPTTRRDGYVQLADAGPTVLELFGEDQPDDVEGRAMRFSADGRRDHVARLAQSADAAQFRDRAVAPVSLALGIGAGLLALAIVARDRMGRTTSGAVRWLAFALLGALPGTFLAGIIDALSLPAYLAAIGVVAIAVGGAALWADRVAPGIGVLVALGSIILVIAGDIAFGAALQLNTVYGYSVAVAGRFAGLGNLAFALLSSATLLASVLVVDRYGKRGIPAAMALLAVVVVVDGLPTLGADVGGVLAMVPAFGLTGLVLLGRRVGWHHLLALGAGAAGAVLAFAFLDLARPASSRTHLARLAEHVIDQRWGPFLSSLTRRWQANFGGAGWAGWATVGLVTLAVTVYVTLVLTRRIGPRAGGRTHHLPTVAAIAGLAMLAMIGLVANDSSFAVPGAMLLVFVPVVAARLVPSL